MFHYTVNSTRGIKETIRKLQDSLQEEKFGVLWEFDVKEKLLEKGLTFDEDFTVLEVCNPHEAKRVLDVNKLAGYFLPCKIVVYVDRGETKIGMPKPTELIKSVDNKKLMEFAADIEKRLMNAINKSV
ncbi:DUF302 domain-containing protein [Evansella sp. AB-P1]|uniref:DUF302 domain-containing protein n=1 Tax=Evansella sp. AB-P1 TaxID=3037653 RepID=UPI00241E9B52|nr:DUF302 domain-containing protein [Evansella sp. AB-P1]MDG5789729.1 DUF302 domain-containing protein [Evansella sp. AB-P1]